jgi:hypothetical protein
MYLPTYLNSSQSDLMLFNEMPAFSSQKGTTSSLTIGKGLKDKVQMFSEI